MGMLRCNLEEDVEPAMARFLGGLNREIQDILAYKEYSNITRLFHLVCKAEREVWGRRASTRTNISIGRNFPRSPAQVFHQLDVLLHLIHRQLEQQPHLLASSLVTTLQIQQ
jgi:hypothetical protein